MFDDPIEERKIHNVKIPNLGGIGIYGAVLLVSSVFPHYVPISQLGYIFAASIILFGLGITDDLVGVKPDKKILGQLTATLIITVLADLRITGFYGFLGVYELPYYASLFFSSMFILLIINAFNLIDGVNWLAGSIGLLCTTGLAFFFYRLNQPGLVVVSISMAGALTGFLYFNKTPAKIFMGDTGSLFLGFVIALLAIRFTEVNKIELLNGKDASFHSAPAIIFSLLIIPIFDTLRIFTVRIIEKKSPFSADRNHIHHRLLDLNFSHLQTTAILVTVTIILVAISLAFNTFNNETLLFINSCIILTLNAFAGHLVSQKIIPIAKVKRTRHDKSIALPHREDMENIRWQSFLLDNQEVKDISLELRTDRYLLNFTTYKESRETAAAE